MFFVIHFGVKIKIVLADDVAQCVCLVDPLGNRTMRPCIATAAKIQVHFSFVHLLHSTIHEIHDRIVQCKLHKCPY